jgi:sarcosine oxidase subunit gamma
MAEFDLQRRHVLEDVEGMPGAEFQTAGWDGFQMRRSADAPRYVLRLTATEARERGADLGFNLDQAINTGRGLETLWAGEPRASLRLGPDEWLLIGAPAAGADLAGLKMTDVSHRNVALEVRGRFVRDVLQTGIALDLDDRAFPAGSATRTLFAKAEIVLVHGRDRSGDSVFRLECWRSFARYLAAHLAQSARLLGVAAR